MNKTLFVGGIDWDATEADVKDAFMEYGSVISVRIVMDRESGRSRGFGFVEMASEKEAELALALDGYDLCGRKLRVNFAREKRP